ncbi:MAG TPA: hypothetical protein VMT61_01910 [Candidatus Binataceae bacterium]|nr:hypothetical protein [Candidatus Binataceae bacterium]
MKLTSSGQSVTKLTAGQANLEMQAAYRSNHALAIQIPRPSSESES